MVGVFRGGKEDCSTVLAGNIVARFMTHKSSQRRVACLIWRSLGYTSLSLGRFEAIAADVVELHG